MFNILQVASFIFFPVFFIFYSKHYDIGKIKGVLMSVVTLAMGYALMFIVTWVESGFKNFGAQNAIRVYVLLPVMGIVCAKLFKTDIRTFLSAFAVSFPSTYFIAHYGCCFAGCCYGFDYAEGTKMHGIAQTLTNSAKLPVQFIEATCALILFVALLIIARKTNYEKSGRLMGISMTAFGFGRFFLEFLRDDNKVIMFTTTKNGIPIGISDLAIYAAIMAIEGIILLVVFSKMKKKETAEEVVAG